MVAKGPESAIRATFAAFLFAAALVIVTLVPAAAPTRARAGARQAWR